MAGVAGVFGGVADALGIYSFLATLFAGKAKNICTVRVAAALNGLQGLNGADGGISAIRIYNENQALIGSRSGAYIGSGGFKDFAVEQPNTQQATFVQIGATNDAICIPWASTTLVDGSPYGWVGDWGYACGLEWYYGNYAVDGSRMPKCTWVDNDHTNNIRAGMLFIHWLDFTKEKTQGDNAKNYCHYPAFRAYTTNNGVGSIFKRDAVEEVSPVKSKRSPDSRLIISTEPSHNATMLCESKTSWGPDLVSLHEKVYCNMETRETLPLCAEDIKTECFDKDAKHKQKRDNTVVKKDFSEVINWP